MENRIKRLEFEEFRANKKMEEIMRSTNYAQ